MYDRSASREKRATVLAAIMSVLMAGGVLLVLYLSLGQVLLYGLAIMGGMVLVGLLHYLLWGRALMAETADERARLLAQEQEENRETTQAATPWERRF